MSEMKYGAKPVESTAFVFCLVFLTVICTYITPGPQSAHVSQPQLTRSFSPANRRNHDPRLDRPDPDQPAPHSRIRVSFFPLSQIQEGASTTLTLLCAHQQLDPGTYPCFLPHLPVLQRQPTSVCSHPRCVWTLWAGACCGQVLGPIATTL